MKAKDQKAAHVLDTGILKTLNVDAIKDDRSFGYNLEGYIKVPETGVYTFWLKVNDGGHRAQILDSKIGLKKGSHPIKVDCFQQGLARSLILKWKGLGVEEQQISKNVLFH